MLKSEQSRGHIRLSGELDFVSVAELLNKPPVSIEASQAENGQIEVDLSAITGFNSAVLTLLLDWMQKAQQNHLKIKYHNAPEQLRVIAQAYGIDQELPLTSA